VFGNRFCAPALREPGAWRSQTEDRMEFAFGQTRITITDPGWPELMAKLRARLSGRMGFALATINLDHLVKLRSDPDFRDIYARQDIVVADGNPIVWLSRLAGRPVALIPGSDLILPLAALAAELDVPVALVGSRADVLDAAARDLQRREPMLRIVLQHAPPMGFDPTGPEAQAILTEIRASGAGLCLIAMGAPKQEAFAATGRDLAPECGFVSIGAGLDFLGGAQRRAPRWVRRLALEWVWRMLSDPRRLALRYWRCARILPAEMRAAWRQRRTSA